MAQLRLILQEPQLAEREAGTVLSSFLRIKMDGGDTRIRRWKSLKEWLGLKSIGCCGATWGGFRPATVHDDDDDHPQEQEIIDLGESPAAGRASDPDCLGLVPAGSGMNLAAALAAERQFRASEESSSDSVGTPVRVSLMRLLEESRDGGGGAAETEEKVGSDQVCCVCMGRKKGAAFIPCGHTFCRVCSRELWLNRGSCPICNRLILEILDIF